MDTIFYDNAKYWVNQSNRDLDNKKYLPSWTKAFFPARLNYIADAISNIFLAVFGCLKACFGILRIGYTWGREAQELRRDLHAIINCLNHIISDIAGLAFVNLGKELRDFSGSLILFGVVVPLSLVLISSL